MYRWISIILILTNFWGAFLVNHIFGTEYYIIPKNEYTGEAIFELSVISIVLLFLGLCCFKLERKSINFDYNIRNAYIFRILFWFFLILNLSKINFSLDNSLRGVGQFELENRAGFIDSLGTFAIPFILFTLYHKVFGNKTNKLIALLSVVMIMSGVTNGGRRTVSYLFISLILYFYYFKDIKIKSIVRYGIVGIGLLTFAMVARNINKPVDDWAYEIMRSFLKVNSDSSFIWGIKDYKAQGINLSPLIFMGHFLSVFIPSFIYSRITGQISYTRASLYFDQLFNTNPNQGYDFMVLADFYWCFDYIGYCLFICIIIFVFRYFKKHIYDKNGYKAIASILMIMYSCQQRNDFGAVFKPVIYSYLFLWILNRISKPQIIK